LNLKSRRRVRNSVLTAKDGAGKKLYTEHLTVSLLDDEGQEQALVDMVVLVELVKLEGGVPPCHTSYLGKDPCPRDWCV
jgi:hypothetical protein